MSVTQLEGGAEPQHARCSSCGLVNRDSARYCTGCGSSIASVRVDLEARQPRTVGATSMPPPRPSDPQRSVGTTPLPPPSPPDQRDGIVSHATAVPPPPTAPPSAGGVDGGLPPPAPFGGLPPPPAVPPPAAEAPPPPKSDVADATARNGRRRGRINTKRVVFVILGSVLVVLLTVGLFAAAEPDSFYLHYPDTGRTEVVYGSPADRERAEQLQTWSRITTQLVMLVTVVLVIHGARPGNWLRRESSPSGPEPADDPGATPSQPSSD